MTDIEIAAEAAKTAADNAAKEAAAKAAAEAAAKAAAATDADLVRMTPAQLKARLDETRVAAEKRTAEQFAAELGIPIADAKKLIAETKAKDDANKSEVQRLTEQLAAAQAKSARLGVLEETVTGRAAVEFGALSDVQRAAVETIAGSDPAARLKTIDALKPSWAAAQKVADDTAQVAKAAADKAAADAAVEAAKKVPIPAGATTTPASPPPPPAQPGTPTNHLAVWESLKVSNPVAAGIYRNKHDAAIRAAQRQATG
jgi:hypothetical protein